MFLQNFMRLQDELDQLFHTTYSGSGRSFPQVNIFDDEKGGAFVLKAELPGVKKEDLNLKIQDDKIVLEGKRVREGGENGDYHRQERSFGKFARSFKLPYRVDQEKTSASFQDGILTVKFEKGKESGARTIQIK